MEDFSQYCTLSNKELLTSLTQCVIPDYDLHNLSPEILPSNFLTQPWLEPVFSNSSDHWPLHCAARQKATRLVQLSAALTSSAYVPPNTLTHLAHFFFIRSHKRSGNSRAFEQLLHWDSISPGSLLSGQALMDLILVWELSFQGAGAAVRQPLAQKCATQRSEHHPAS